MTKTNASLDKEWNVVIGSGVLGAKGTATAASATSLTDSGATWGTTQFIGSLVVGTPASGGLVYANVISHTGTVLTVDRWYDAVTPGGTAGTTPGTNQYVIIPGQSPSMFMGISANASAVGAGDTTLVGEITTAGGGLIRKIAALTHSASAATGTVVAVFTANGTDSLPQTIHKMGISNSLLSTVINLLQTVLNADATITTSGDQLTITDTITL
jgi:hypothetical protein